ncbi:hypothetical protein CGRA01v4_13461 [Colletotrichum graminicola]|uniref:Uncharacterized protein n=1 Tax=Colletotrichum graminicola (strain M1.001 / M2 / FGSC 10212) TaxID=645133 RepID=E3R0C7_COLGM|nr:uncharacterized protein GLRG_11724 [Colletotrichum graminicola M1.001]EFQ36565.1 hypothetical protein GLRG_11724 [Colletotrichum graminicola M1.001]WDK22171.1 hypothetical protein CGRA01v4_13461 [Colletotrichum graminicola]
MILTYYPTSDLEAEFSYIGHHRCRGIFHPAIYEGGEPTPAAERFHEMSKGCKLPLWVLHPGIYTTCGRLSGWRVGFSQVIVPYILGLIQRKRQMHTRLRLPDDTITFPYYTGDGDCNKIKTEAAKLF